MKQKTLRQGFSLAGVGIHSGTQTKITISPAPIDAGLVFQLAGQKIPLSIKNVSGSKLATSLGPIIQVEHLLAAISGLGINNLLVACSAAEIPILDGSSLPFVAALEKAGLIEQNKLVPIATLAETITIKEEDKLLVAEPADKLTIEFSVDYPVIGQQAFFFDGTIAAFKKDLAPARTFGYEKDLKELHNSGLAKGASLENALGINDQGYMNPPRFLNEPVRHKILDLIGDLALLGRPLNARIKANKSSHRLNHELVRRILKDD